jgi:hypothetical protein
MLARSTGPRPPPIPLAHFRPIAHGRDADRPAARPCRTRTSRRRSPSGKRPVARSPITPTPAGPPRCSNPHSTRSRQSARAASRGFLPWRLADAGRAAIPVTSTGRHPQPFTIATSLASAELASALVRKTPKTGTSDSSRRSSFAQLEDMYSTVGAADTHFRSPTALSKRAGCHLFQYEAASPSAAYGVQAKCHVWPSGALEAAAVALHQAPESTPGLQLRCGAHICGEPRTGAGPRLPRPAEC